MCNSARARERREGYRQWFEAMFERFDAIATIPAAGEAPEGLGNTDIPFEARILAVADSYDAMTSDRPYRKASSFAEARAEIARCAATQFDPRCVEAFLQLSDGELAALRARPSSP